MSETVKNKHVKKKNPIGLVFKTVITVFLLFLTGYVCTHFMEYQKNGTNQVNKYRLIHLKALRNLLFHKN